MVMPLKISYQSEGFPGGGQVANGRATLSTSWDELLWAALTVGRPNRQFVFRHGESYYYEAIFRQSLVRMALEERGGWHNCLVRTEAARTLDPSEKGAVNYFLGMAICKLFAARLLNVEWMIHLDFFRPRLNPVLSGRSRPDLVGETGSGKWVAMECKGRASPPALDAKEKAKAQAQRLVSVNGKPPAYQVGGIAFFRNEELEFYWRDPDPDPDVEDPIELVIEPEMIRYYYQPVLGLVRSDTEAFERMLHEPVLARIENTDTEVGIYPALLRLMIDERWNAVGGMFNELRVMEAFKAYQKDGIKLVAGESWSQPRIEG